MNPNIQDLIDRRKRADRFNKLPGAGKSMMGCGCLGIIFISFAAAGGAYASPSVYGPYLLILFLIGLTVFLTGKLVARTAAGSYQARLHQIRGNSAESEELSDFLLKNLENGQFGMNGEYIRILGDIGDNHAVDLIIPVLKHTNPEFRRTAVTALENIGDERAVQPLLELLNDKDGTVQKLAAAALKKLGWEPNP